MRPDRAVIGETTNAARRARAVIFTAAGVTALWTASTVLPTGFGCQWSALRSASLLPALLVALLLARVIGGAWRQRAAGPLLGFAIVWWSWGAAARWLDGATAWSSGHAALYDRGWFPAMALAVVAWRSETRTDHQATLQDGPERVAKNHPPPSNQPEFP